MSNLVYNELSILTMSIGRHSAHIFVKDTISLKRIVTISNSPVKFKEMTSSYMTETLMSK